MDHLTEIKNRRALVIDDNGSIHDDFRKILSPDTAARFSLGVVERELFGNPANEPEQIQFEIDSAYQGNEGVARVMEALEAKRPYAMVFVDMRMPPGWDGIKTAQEIWKIDAEIQIVLCTAYLAYSSDEISKKIGNTARMFILKKPFDIGEAFQLANELTEQWQLIHYDGEKSVTDTKITEETNPYLPCL
jgi:two-component system NtrC family sensor kinase